MYDQSSFKKYAEDRRSEWLASHPDVARQVI